MSTTPPKWDNGPDPVDPSIRHTSIDAVRGFAVLGILLMNIVSMGLPGFAYVDPSYYGGSTGANAWTWAIMFVVADGKMRTLFTLLFGASLLLIADRARLNAGRLGEGRLGPVALTYRRAFWLWVIGVAHHVFLWNGDILMFYALAGAVAFPFRRWKPWLLVAVGLALYAGLTAWEVWDNLQYAHIRDAALAPGASQQAIDYWRAAQDSLGPPKAAIPADLATYRGGFWTEAKARFSFMVLRHTVLSRLEYVEALALILAGMGLFKLGFFTLRWSTRAYAALIGAGLLVGLPLTAWMAAQVVGSGFDQITNFTMGAWSAVPRLFIAAAYASAVLLLVRFGALRWLTERLAAAGRMALSNYLASSLIGAIVFDGWAFGLYGHLQRWQLYIVVAGVWIAALAWSKPWLARFHFGPAEWLWRSLVQLRPQPFGKRAKAALA